MRADTSAHQDGARCLLCYIFLPSYHFTDGWRRGWCDKALYPSGHALFSPTLISRGHRSTTPKWCVGVCSGLARVWVTGLVHPHRHDTAQKNRLTGLPAEAARIVWPVLRVCVRRVYFVPVWAGESVWKKCLIHTLVLCSEKKVSYPHSCPMCAVMSAMQHSGIFSGVSIVYVVCLDTSQGCLLDERITGTVGNRRMIFWLYRALSGGDTPAITGSLLHLLLVKCSPEIGTNWE